jgi:hypothetical protein
VPKRNYQPAWAFGRTGTTAEEAKDRQTAQRNHATVYRVVAYFFFKSLQILHLCCGCQFARLPANVMLPGHGMQGTSFTALLDDPQNAGKEVAYTVVSRGKILGRSIRTKQWRYAKWGSSDQAELYDLNADPHEDHNLAGSDNQRQQLGEP